MEQTEEELELEAFNSVFTRDDEPPAKTVAVEETPADKPAAEEVKTETKVETKVEEKEEEVDEFAGLPPKVRELLAEIPQLRAAASKVPELTGRIAKLQSWQSKQMERSKEAPQLDSIRQELPDVAKALEDFHQRITPVEPDPEPTQSAPAQDPAMSAMDAVRPTWKADAKHPDFKLWLSTQQESYQQEFRDTEDPGLFLGVLGKWDSIKAAREAKQVADRDAAAKAASVNATRTQRMAAAVQPTSARQAPAPKTEVDDETAGYLSVFAKSR